MSTTYTIELDETNTDLQTLDGAKYNFALAKEVQSAGGTTYNTIFLSSTDTADQKVTNHNKLSWSENYALNYTFSFPGKGVVVTGEGNWQPMNLGDYYQIDSTGAWVAGTGPASTNLNVTNDFQELNIIVGIQMTDASGHTTYNPIYVDPSALLMKAEGTYLPLETIDLWWGEKQVTSTIIESQSTPVERYTLDGTTEVYFLYDPIAGVWHSQTSGPFPTDGSSTK